MQHKKAFYLFWKNVFLVSEKGSITAEVSVKVADVCLYVGVEKHYAVNREAV